MDFNHKMKLLVNDPAFNRNFSTTPKSAKQNILKNNQAIKNVFPSILQIERFKHLEQARVNSQEDKQYHSNVTKLIQNFHISLKTFAKKQIEIQTKKQSVLGRLKLDYVQQQMDANLHQLQKLIQSHQEINENIMTEKNFIQKSLKMTQIKKALKIQNQMLKKENQKLKNQQKEADRQNYLYIEYWPHFKNDLYNEIAEFDTNLIICWIFYIFQLQSLMFDHLKNIHKNFILRPNPYVTKQQAESAYTKFVMGQVMIMSSIGCFILSLMKLFPRLSRNVIFKKFTVFQAGTSLICYGLYFYDVYSIGKTIPQSQLHVNVPRQQE